MKFDVIQKWHHIQYFEASLRESALNSEKKKKKKKKKSSVLPTKLQELLFVKSPLCCSCTVCFKDKAF